jgi:ubiquinone/menaquinone biosynthesis C-methylase UbiE
MTGERPHLQPDNNALSEKKRKTILERLSLVANLLRSLPEDILTSSVFDELKPDDIEYFGQRLLAARSMQDAYRISAEKTTGGRALYDVVVSPQHNIANESLGKAVRKKNKKKDLTVLDLGAGTGNTALSLLRHGVKASEVFLVDTSESLLDVAHEKINQAYPDVHVHKLVADMSQPFGQAIPPNYIDVVVTQAAIGCIPEEKRISMYQEHIPPVLKKGGMVYRYLHGLGYESYIRALYNTNNFNNHPKAIAAGLLMTSIFSHLTKYPQGTLPDLSSQYKVRNIKLKHEGFTDPDVVEYWEKK